MSNVSTARSLVTHRPTTEAPINWKLENVAVAPIRDDELLVRIVAAGICHTDVAFSTLADTLGMLPRVLGHEGLHVSLATASTRISADKTRCRIRRGRWRGCHGSQSRRPCPFIIRIMRDVQSVQRFTSCILPRDAAAQLLLAAGYVFW
jgi:hypothetical protein